MLPALTYSHDQLKELTKLFPNGLFIDATIGNGHDIYYILNQPHFNGTVYGFDIQKEAIEATQNRLSRLPAEKQNQYQLFHQTHDQIADILGEDSVYGGIFNLGYLPGGDHAVTTQAESTIESLKQIGNRLVKHGKIILVVYWGHPEGKIESQALLDELATWPQEDYQVLQYQFINQQNQPPYAIVIEKK